MKKILVTGGCGFIGSNFIKHMLEEYDYPIWNVDKLTYAGKENNLGGWIGHHNYHFHQADINEYATLHYMIRQNKIDTIINFAAESHVDRSIENSDDFIETNINGTHSLLKLLHEYSADDLKAIVPSILTDDCRYVLSSFWVNFQKKYEFNPLH